jgi:hypothetical protein
MHRCSRFAYDIPKSRCNDFKLGRASSKAVPRVVAEAFGAIVAAAALAVCLRALMEGLVSQFGSLLSP